MEGHERQETGSYAVAACGLANRSRYSSPARAADVLEKTMLTIHEMPSDATYYFSAPICVREEDKVVASFSDRSDAELFVFAKSSLCAKCRGILRQSARAGFAFCEDCETEVACA